MNGHRLRIGSGFTSSSWSCDGKLLALAADGYIDVYQTRTGRVVFQVRSAHRHVQLLRFAPDNRHLDVLRTDGNGLQERLELVRYDVRDKKAQPMSWCSDVHRAAAAWVAHASDDSRLALYLVNHRQQRERATGIFFRPGKAPWSFTGRQLAQVDLAAMVIDEEHEGAAIVWTAATVERWTWAPGRRKGLPAREKLVEVQLAFDMLSRPHPGSTVLAFFDGRQQRCGLWDFRRNHPWVVTRRPATKAHEPVRALFTATDRPCWAAVVGGHGAGCDNWLELREPGSPVQSHSLGRAAFVTVDSSCRLVFLARHDGRRDLYRLEQGKLEHCMDWRDPVARAVDQPTANNRLFAIAPPRRLARRRRLAALVDDGLEDSHVLAYADWLADSGERLWFLCAWALREEIALQASKEDGLPEDCATARYQALFGAALAAGFSVAVEAGLVRLVASGAAAQFEGKSPFGQFYGHPSCSEVDGLSLQGPWPVAVLDQLADSRRLRGLVELELSDTGSKAKDMASFFAADHLQGLRHLSMAHEELGPSAALSLAKHMPQLCSLSVVNSLVAANPDQGGPVDRAVRAFGRAPWAPRLRWLDLSANGLGDDALEAIVDSPLLAGLAALVFGPGDGSNEVGDRGIQLLAASPAAGDLRCLVLHKTKLTADGLAALFDSSSLQDVVMLAIGGIGYNLDDPFEVTEPLREASPRPALRALDLSWSKFTAESARELCRSPLLAGLEVLDLTWNELGDEGAHVLAASPALQGLRRLHLDANGIGRAGWRALANSPHLSREVTDTMRRRERSWLFSLPGTLAGRFRYLRRLGSAAPPSRCG